MIYKHAAFQFGIAIAALSLFAATDTWYLVTGFSIASTLNTLVAALAGIAITTIVHEWFHYFGARLVGARYTVPEKFGLFVYDYDFEANNLRQFNTMSIAGQVGSWFSVVMLWSALPMDTSGRVMLVAGAVTSALFAGMVELPVLKRVQRSGNPLEELSKIDLPTLRRSALGGVSGGLLIWYLAS